MNNKDILLLHGALGAKSQFSGLLLLLQEAFQAQAMDFEGHGEEPLRDRPFRIDYFVDNVLAFMTERELDKVNIFGHSMGGYVGLYLAKAYPDKVEKVFTFGTKFAWTPDFARQEVAALDADKLLAKVPRFAKALEERHAVPGWREVMAQTRTMMLGLGEEPPLGTETLSQISQPVRIGVGDRDHMVSLEESLSVYRALPAGELQVFPGTPHPLERVSVTMLAQAIAQFFGG